MVEIKYADMKVCQRVSSLIFMLLGDIILLFKWANKWLLPFNKAWNLSYKPNNKKENGIILFNSHSKSAKII